MFSKTLSYIQWSILVQPSFDNYSKKFILDLIVDYKLDAGIQKTQKLKEMCSELVIQDTLLNICSKIKVCYCILMKFKSIAWKGHIVIKETFALM